MIKMVQATSQCTLCGKRFYQIDSTPDRALSITNAALDRHLDDEHPDRGVKS